MQYTQKNDSQKKRAEKEGREISKTGKWMAKENTKSEKCEANSGTILKSKNKAFKYI